MYVDTSQQNKAFLIGSIAKGVKKKKQRKLNRAHGAQTTSVLKMFIKKTKAKQESSKSSLVLHARQET